MGECKFAVVNSFGGISGGGGGFTGLEMIFNVLKHKGREFQHQKSIYIG